MSQITLTEELYYLNLKKEKIHHCKKCNLFYSNDISYCAVCKENLTESETLITRK